VRTTNPSVRLQRVPPPTPPPTPRRRIHRLLRLPDSHCKPLASLKHGSSTGAVSGYHCTVFLLLRSTTSFSVAESLIASATKLQASALAGAPAEAPGPAASDPRVTDALLLSSVRHIAMCSASLVQRGPRPQDAQPLPVRRCPRPWLRRHSFVPELTATSL
jgi:hypothetical protein